jgi:hypothetical protein
VVFIEIKIVPPLKFHPKINEMCHIILSNFLFRKRIKNIKNDFFLKKKIKNLAGLGVVSATPKISLPPPSDRGMALYPETGQMGWLWPPPLGHPPWPKVEAVATPKIFILLFFLKKYHFLFCLIIFLIKKL